MECKCAEMQNSLTHIVEEVISFMFEQTEHEPDDPHRYARWAKKYRAQENVLQILNQFNNTLHLS